MTLIRPVSFFGNVSGRLLSLPFILMIVTGFFTSGRSQVQPLPGFPVDSLHLKRDAMLGDTSAARRNMRSDSLGIGADSLRALGDTLSADSAKHWTVYLDSTARMEQWVHDRQDDPVVNMFPRPRYSLYLDPNSQIYSREVKLDTLGQTVTVRELVNGLDVKVPTTLTLEEYIKERYQYEKANNWRTFAGQYTMKADRDELGNVLGAFTNISIPVPANPLFSIFGRNYISLRISGAVDVRGAFRNTSSDQSTISSLDQSRSEPNFNQDVQINVNGTIGDKLNIMADWNTQRTFEYENQLKIKYTGYDDEIVQSVEAGNVSLQTPALVGGGQALFGIKAKLQTGPLTLTTLLSQKKGQTKELTVSGGSTTTEISVQPSEYRINHFFVDRAYRGYFEALHQTQVPTLTQDILDHQIIQMDVYLSFTSGALQNQNRIWGKAYINIPTRGVNENYSPDMIAYMEATDRKIEGNYKDGYFIRLDPNKDYKFDQYGGHITLLTSFTDDQAIAVTYTYAGQNNKNRVYGGTVAGNDTVFYLKLIKPQNLRSNPSYKPAWDLMLKNIYSVGATNLKKEGFELKIWRRTQGTDVDAILGQNLMAVVGLDRFDQFNSPKPDNAFDFMPGLTIDVDRGEVIFPTLEPFRKGIKDYLTIQNKIVSEWTAEMDTLLFGDIYDTTAMAAQNNSIGNKYVLKVKAAGAQSSRFSLGGMNLVEGSVQVLFNGTPMMPNVDYTVDYIIGEVVIRKPEALLPGANVQVKYEQNDLFQLASKTLMGARGELNLFPNTNLGFTLMNLNQATLSDKVRLNEEPTNNMVLGVDASTTANLPFLTDAIDALPLIRTKEMSTIRFGGEAAYMVPDPNTKKSLITSDEGASIAYIDDFEGARRTIPLSINYSSWTPASPPVYSFMGSAMTDTDKTYRKARLSWYNRLPSDVVATEIWPKKQTRSGQNQVMVLNMDYDPDHRGTYNFSPNVDSTLHRSSVGGNSGRYDSAEARRKNWNGMMRYIGTTAGSIYEQNITYLEIWAKAITDDQIDLRNGRLFIDLGRVNEDVIPNGVLNSEDVIRTSTNPLGIPNGVLNEGEDLGLDMLDDGQEAAVYQKFLTSNAGDPDVDPADPSGDDYAPYIQNSAVQPKFNGTENNKRDPSGLMPNTEDLNGNGSVDLSNQYLEYELPLDTLYVDSIGSTRQNLLRVGGGENGWYQFRIPLLEATRVIGSSTAQSILQNVQYIRLWVSGFAKPVVIRIAEMDLVGNQWQERAQNDSLVKASVVNIEDNLTYGREWPDLGMVREKDRTDPNQVIEGNEQSLDLILNGLPRDTSRQIVKYFNVRPLDLFNYKSMKMFVHGDLSFNYLSPDQHDAQIFIRFGSDSLNFYEYREPIHPGWDLPDNQMNIIFARLTSVKSARDSANKIYRRAATGGPPGSTFAVLGNPSLRQVREISVGIVNVGGPPKLYGHVWINELRLIDVDNSPGLAYRFDSQVKLADFGSFAFNYSRTDPNFHALDQRFGSQMTGINWAVNASLALERFFPQDWQGTSVPVGYSHSEGLVKPKYLPNTDVVVDAASAIAPTAAQADKIITESQTLNVRDSYSVSSFRIVPPSQAWYVRDTFSKLSLGFSYNTSHDRDPSIAERRSWLWNLRVSYGVSLPPDYYIQPFKDIFNGVPLLGEFKEWKLYYIPITNISAGTGGQRSKAYEVARALNSLPRETRNFGANKTFGFGWKFTEGGLTNISGDYGLSIDRNLLSLDNDTAGRGFGAIMKNLFFGGTDGRYGQRITINSKPKIPNILDITKYFDVGAGYGVNYSWQNTFQQGDIGKSAGWDNNISLTLNLRLKSLVDPWFESKDEPAQAKQAPPPEKATRRERPSEEPPDTAGGKQAPPKAPPDTSKSKSLFTQLRYVAKLLLKIPLLDYETINISYSQTNRSGNGAVVGGTGFKNFWGRLPFQGSLIQNGPSRLYQLGLISDPSGTLRFSPTSGFPFIGWKTEPGLRAPRAQFTDQYSQGNTINLRTNRPLWEGASVDINWKVNWQYSKSTTMVTDSLGIPKAGEPTTAGSIERSFLTLPPVLMFKVLKSNMEDVGKKYDQLVSDLPADDPGRKSALAESFEKGLEALPFLSKVLGQYVPRPNWTLRWDGIEKIAGINSYVDRLSLEHNYSSSFRRDYRSYPGRGEQTDVERISYGFSPLAAVNATFKQFLKGNMSGNLRYNTTTAFDLNLASTPMNIVETLAQEMALTITYSRRGFSFPLFGLNLTNDVDVSLTYSRTKNGKKRYDPQLLSSGQEGIPLEGSTRTLLEPRIRYVLSSRVTAAIFYRYTKTAPDEGGSLIFGTTTNEAGVDIHISIP